MCRDREEHAREAAWPVHGREKGPKGAEREQKAAPSEWKRGHSHSTTGHSPWWSCSLLACPSSVCIIIFLLSVCPALRRAVAPPPHHKAGGGEDGRAAPSCSSARHPIQSRNMYSSCPLCCVPVLCVIMTRSVVIDDEEGTQWALPPTACLPACLTSSNRTHM